MSKKGDAKVGSIEIWDLFGSIGKYWGFGFSTRLNKAHSNSSKPKKVIFSLGDVSTSSS